MKCFIKELIAMLLICLIVLGMGETVTISQFEDM